ncbi:hypothetical protein COCC4DRAFT_33200 [Bipolaris maydis ATCC 48331]|uniref:Uncharacterized protein n=2 Tax=Cochliobolus heterostrophus TaxID=5016 RepID=M2TJZ9_COCH5|nr:uncharacterized protein COCC4DRAFT_33200 [Bipolaris maydis ATCC 48331]EMD86799.1 hypothetical protein COCHEDRAFT_1023911 [Bipolaris maydis C5]KAJ5047786.1 ankyrin repeat-containing domain protein [Bipolaris maydis]ENI03186.1 hypothetical protein COCC4DRAFT_33200 [Bipolaris maydis ATCC 48331]KAJ5052492.1 ankyrin repeat-containing domain protein [Bipolaris maydis]KAJ6192176.1 ankyrin repeat-containing domain protein [Bipolaris maydis]
MRYAKHAIYLCQTLTRQLYQCGGTKLAKAIPEKNGVHAVSAWIRSGAKKGTVLYGFTALTRVSICSDVNIIDMVLATDGDIESVVESNGRTPLSYAAEYGELQNVKRLVEAGCSTNVAANNGETPLSLAVTNGHLDTVKYLLIQGVKLKLDGLLQSKISGNDKMVKLLRRHGVR